MKNTHTVKEGGKFLFIETQASELIAAHIETLNQNMEKITKTIEQSDVEVAQKHERM